MQDFKLKFYPPEPSKCSGNPMLTFQKGKETKESIFVMESLLSETVRRPLDLIVERISCEYAFRLLVRELLENRLPLETQDIRKIRNDKFTKA